MAEPKQFSITLPVPLSDSQSPSVVKSPGSIVIVGANGSGKTRLGAWIELNSEHKQLSHRVSAQKSLTMPESVRSEAVDVADRRLRYGHEGNRELSGRVGNRWGGRPETTALDDFSSLMCLLFSEEAEKNAEFKRQAKIAKDRIEPPETKLDIIKKVWEALLPTRELMVASGRVLTRVRGKPDSYNASQMSDGERVIFYLIGECLIVPASGVIVIDEPELHIHKSVQAPLWDAIEAERPDCLFVYLTHDLDFAASRRRATKVWLKEFDGARWDWQIVPKEDGVPEEMLLALIGSRKPILFVEGDRGSWDYFLYSRLYPEFTVVPCNNAEGVLHATASFAARKDMHSLSCRGIIDKDYRSDERIAYLKERNVYAPDVSEVENLFLVEDVLRAVASDFLVRDVDAAVAGVKDMVFEEMTRERDRLVSAITAAAIETSLSAFDAKAIGQAELAASLDRLFKGIDVPGTYTAVAARIDRTLATRNYPDAIKVYNNKGLIHRAGKALGYKGDFPDYLQRLISDKRGMPVLAAMKKAAPVIAP